MTVRGSISLDADGYSGNGFRNGARCFGSDGFDDIDSGAQVTVSDDSGHTLAITHLRGGHVADFLCRFKFTAHVPAGKGFYGVEVTHRGVVKESEADLGDVELSLTS